MPGSIYRVAGATGDQLRNYDTIYTSAGHGSAVGEWRGVPKQFASGTCGPIAIKATKLKLAINVEDDRAFSEHRRWPMPWKRATSSFRLVVYLRKRRMASQERCDAI